ncbi:MULTISPECIES: TonB-dependent receptor [unclassified Microcoleus]|uniref:TonB-dependent receptor n=1 Tax=unclassified Microcoleus TaxID=2642155 RepID=UPI002FD618BC
MKYCLIISDLSYLEPINESEITVVVGGGNVYADTFATTAAGRGYAIAVAGGLAIGNQTYTNTVTNTTVKDLGNLEYSRAYATGTAYANTGNQTASSTIRSTSISFFGR